MILQKDDIVTVTKGTSENNGFKAEIVENRGNRALVKMTEGKYSGQYRVYKNEEMDFVSHPVVQEANNG